MKMLAIARNGIRPSFFPVMAQKVYLRARYGTARERIAATEWAAGQAEDMDSWARRRDAELWEESLSFAQNLRRVAQPRIDEVAALGIDLGGGGSHELLYFLTRLLRPEVVLETGVAAGWSTSAFLSGIRENGSGHLYSSDFPYFRMPNPERYVGCIVPDELRGPWTLRTKGDRRNLEEMLGPDMAVNLVHYDSDKSRGGREWFMGRIAGYLARNAVVVMDDINDDLFFRNHFAGNSVFHVFAYHGKYIGVVGI